MNKHPLEHKCGDCNGTGIYQGLGALEDCQACKGHGSFIGVEMEIESTYPKNTKKEDWDELAESFKKQIRDDADDITLIKGKGAPGLQVGETVYVYNAGWYEGKAEHIYENMHGGQMVRVDHSGGVFRMAIKNICWNITEDRWEYIRSGTPVW